MMTNNETTNRAQRTRIYHRTVLRQMSETYAATIVTARRALAVDMLLRATNVPGMDYELVPGDLGRIRQLKNIRTALAKVNNNSDQTAGLISDQIVALEWGLREMGQW